MKEPKITKHFVISKENDELLRAICEKSQYPQSGIVNHLLDNFRKSNRKQLSIAIK